MLRVEPTVTGNSRICDRRLIHEAADIGMIAGMYFGCLLSSIRACVPSSTVMSSFGGGQFWPYILLHLRKYAPWLLLLNRWVIIFRPLCVTVDIDYRMLRDALRGNSYG